MPRLAPQSQSTQKARQQKTSRIDYPVLKGPPQPQDQGYQQSPGNVGRGKKLPTLGARQLESPQFQHGNAPAKIPDAQYGWHNTGPKWENDPGPCQSQYNPRTSQQDCNGPMWSNRSGPTWGSNPESGWQSPSRQQLQSSTRPAWYSHQEANRQERQMPRGHQPSHAGPIPRGGGWSNDPGPYQEPRWQENAGLPSLQAGPGWSRAQQSQKHAVVRISSFSSNNSESFETERRVTKGSNAGRARSHTAMMPTKYSSENVDNFSDAKPNILQNSKSSGKRQSPAKPGTRTLRVITSTIHGAKKWNKNKNVLGLTMFEVFGIVDSATLKDSSATGKEFLLRDEGNGLTCIFYEIDRQLPRLVRGQWYRCVGKFKPEEEKFQCFSIRLATAAERKLGPSAMRQAETYLLRLGKEP